MKPAKWIVPFISAVAMFATLGPAQAADWQEKMRDKFLEKALAGFDKALECGSQGQNCGAAKCLAVDVKCLEQAKAKGTPVRIVDEAELDQLRCAATDVECLKRAKTLGKPVEIIG
jgi:hypothetical protein